VIPMSEPIPPSSSRLRMLLRNPFFWAALSAMITIPLLRPFLRHIPEPPPVLGTLPAFQLTNQEGRPYGTVELRGKIWIANFIFTTCHSICPTLTRAMHSLQDRFEKGAIPVKLVSITVDPENDTPERLKAYAQKYAADPRRWSFLTGPEPAVRAVISDGFNTYMGTRRVESQNLVDIAHASTLVLVDGQGDIRGYYSCDESGLDEIFHRAQHVLRQQESRP
jgi:protein SCO1